MYLQISAAYNSVFVGNLDSYFFIMLVFSAGSLHELGVRAAEATISALLLCVVHVIVFIW